MIYIQDSRGEWHWVTPAHTRRGMHRLLTIVVATCIALFGAALILLLSARYARSAEMPKGWTCSQVRQIAIAVGGSLTWDRERTIAIAASYGVVLTEEQLRTLERCFR